jgi:hypothetical protein
VVDELEGQGYEVTRFIDAFYDSSAHGIGVVRIPA